MGSAGLREGGPCLENAVGMNLSVPIFNGLLGVGMS